MKVLTPLVIDKFTFYRDGVSKNFKIGIPVIFETGAILIDHTPAQNCVIARILSSVCLWVPK